MFNEGELEEQSTCAKFAHMGNDGLQQYETVMYNLDVIISVGYRVKSQRGTAFQIWATKVLKEYMLRGYAVNQRLLAMEERMEIGIKYFSCSSRKNRFLRPHKPTFPPRHLLRQTNL